MSNRYLTKIAAHISVDAKILKTVGALGAAAIGANMYKTHSTAKATKERERISSGSSIARELVKKLSPEKAEEMLKSQRPNGK